MSGIQHPLGYVTTMEEVSEISLDAETSVGQNNFHKLRNDSFSQSSRDSQTAAEYVKVLLLRFCKQPPSASQHEYC